MSESSEKDRAKAQGNRWVGHNLRGKWLIEKLIGMGGMANVYAARHRNGRQVAIKLLHESFAEHPEVRQRFLREGYIANRIEHPGVVGILDDDETDTGLAFLVMELLRGMSLLERMEAVKALPLAEALFVADQLLDILNAAHEAGVVHRDIKPGNIFLLQDGRVKVLDFGLARVLDGQPQVLTAQGLVMGTVSFMSPEQARAVPGTVDHRADLYSVAATLFSCLTGEFVFPARNVMERLGLLISKEARSIGSVLPHLPGRVTACIDRALQSDPDLRWPHAAAMQWEIRESFEELTGNRIPETRRQRLHGISGWARPVSPAAASLEPSHHTTSIDVSIVFEPEASQEHMSIPLDVDIRHL